MTRDEVRTLQLLDYYRSQVNHPIERSRPPAGFWIKEGKKGFVWGLLSDGDLIPEGRADEYNDALRKCWSHYDFLHAKGGRHKASRD